MAHPLKPIIERDGQSYVDEPVFAMPTALACAVARSFNHPVPTPIVLGHERTRLLWMTRKNGRLVPRKGQ